VTKLKAEICAKTRPVFPEGEKSRAKTLKNKLKMLAGEEKKISIREEINNRLN
jgi:hypothetical protein